MTWTTSYRWHATAALIAITALSACAPLPAERRPVELEPFADLFEPHVIVVSVYSCKGHPEITTLIQDKETVSVEITSTVLNPSEDCEDALGIELDEPLGDRRLIDLTSGTTIPVNRTAIGESESGEPLE
jgi:hypothetical protein